MTCIVNFKTKKALKEAVKNGKTVFISDPSIVCPYSGRLQLYMETHKRCCVTNHPKRSWFAEIVKKNGKLVVK
ncbi:MAG: hypothetical protein PVF58_14065 [Candidatus Methanofastidiosia archaeon]|jgi:hypothetical protein